MYRFVCGISAQEHDAFVKSSKQCNLLQSASWGKIKANLRDSLNEFFWKSTKRRPMILPILMEV